MQVTYTGCYLSARTPQAKAGQEQAQGSVVAVKPQGGDLQLLNAGAFEKGGPVFDQAQFMRDTSDGFSITGSAKVTVGGLSTFPEALHVHDPAPSAEAALGAPCVRPGRRPRLTGRAAEWVAANPAAAAVLASVPEQPVAVLQPEQGEEDEKERAEQGMRAQQAVQGIIRPLWPADRAACAGCGAPPPPVPAPPLPLCHACLSVRFCSAECARLHWPAHMSVCASARRSLLASQQLAGELRQAAVAQAQVDGGQQQQG